MRFFVQLCSSWQDFKTARRVVPLYKSWASCSHKHEEPKNTTIYYCHCETYPIAVQMCMYCRGREATAMSSDWHTGQELPAVWRQRCTPLPTISTDPQRFKRTDRRTNLIGRLHYWLDVSHHAVGICLPPNVNYIYRRLQRSIPLLYSTVLRWCIQLHALTRSH